MPLSPRVAVLIGAAIVAGLVLWMARDSIRPFILGLLFVYLLDPPVRWLVRRGLRRIFAILLVYVVGIVLFIEFLSLTLTPLVNEVVRFAADFPKLAENLDSQVQRLGEFYQHLEIPLAIREWIDGIIAGIGKGGSGGGGGADLSFLLPLITGASSLLGAVFAYFILPVWVAYILKDKTTLRRRPSIGLSRQPGGSTPGRSSGPSSATSGSGSAARSCSASRSASRRSSV